MPKAKAKEHNFKFKSKKGQEVIIKYKPTKEINVKNEKAFQGHLEKVADLIQCSGYKVNDLKKDKEKDQKQEKKQEQPPIKGIDEV